MKWNNNGITFRRGCHDILIAQYDGKGDWFCNVPMMAQQTAKSCFRELGKYLGAKTVEVKYLFDENDNATVPETTDFLRFYDGSYKFIPRRHEP